MYVLCMLECVCVLVHKNNIMKHLRMAHGLRIQAYVKYIHAWFVYVVCVCVREEHYVTATYQGRRDIPSMVLMTLGSSCWY